MGSKTVRYKLLTKFNYCFLLTSLELDACKELIQCFNPSLLSIAIRNEPLTYFS